MSDTTDCDDGSSGGTSHDADPFGLDLPAETGVEGDGTAEAEPLYGHVEQYDDAPDECTIFPRTASTEFPRTTTWLTAKEGSYLSLEDAR